MGGRHGIKKGFHPTLETRIRGKPCLLFHGDHTLLDKIESIFVENRQESKRQTASANPGEGLVTGFFLLADLSMLLNVFSDDPSGSPLTNDSVCDKDKQDNDDYDPSL